MFVSDLIVSMGKFCCSQPWRQLTARVTALFNIKPLYFLFVLTKTVEKTLGKVAKALKHTVFHTILLLRCLCLTEGVLGRNEVKTISDTHQSFSCEIFAVRAASVPRLQHARLQVSVDAGLRKLSRQVGQISTLTWNMTHACFREVCGYTHVTRFTSRV